MLSFDRKMTTIFAGSNFGFISTLNSGSGNIPTGGLAVTFSYENVNNYNTISILLTTSGGSQLLLRVYSAADISGTQENVQEVLITKTGSNNYTFYPNGPFVKVELFSNADNITYNVQTRYQNAAPPPPNDGTLSTLNSFVIDAAIASNDSISGTYEDISNVSIIKILTAADGASPGSVYPAEFSAYFSADGINDDRIITYPIQDISANGSASSTTALTFNPAHTLIPLAKYFKINFTNGIGLLANLRVTTSYHNTASKPLTSRSTQYLTDYFDADTSRSILSGRTYGTTLPGGHYQNIGVSGESLNVGIKGPVTAFGELLTAQNTPIVQVDFSSGYPFDVLSIRRNSTTNTTYSFVNGALQAQVLAANSIISVQSRQYIKYKTGEGIDARMTCKFQGYVEGASQFVGLTNIEDRVGFGYFDANVSGTNEFCIYYQRHGLVTIAAFDITGTATANGTLTYTFGGTNVPVSFLNGDSAKTCAFKTKTAVEAILNLNTYGWIDDYYITGTDANATVIFYYNNPSNVSVSAVSSGSGISIATNSTLSRAGALPTTTYIPQSTWNVDTCKDMGSLLENYNANPTGFRLDPTKGNVYKIDIQYLGFGTIRFYVENPETGSFFMVHKIKYANDNVITNFGIPSFRIGYRIENTTNTGTVSLICPSLFAAIQGYSIPSPIYRAYGYTLSGNDISVPSTSPRVIFGVKGRNALTSTNSDGTTVNIMNRNNVIFNFVSGACIVSNANSTANITFVIIRNPTTIYYLSNNTAPSWTYTANRTLFTFSGTPATATTGVVYTGGEVITQLVTLDNQAINIDITNERLFATPDDTILLAYYGGFSGSTYDIIGSLSWLVNM